MARTESGVTQWLRWLILFLLLSLSVAIAESTNLQTELTIMHVHFNLYCNTRNIQVGQYSLSTYSQITCRSPPTANTLLTSSSFCGPTFISQQLQRWCSYLY